MRILFFHYGDEAWFGIAYLSAVLKNAGHRTDLLLYPPLDLYMNLPFFRKHIEKRLMDQARAFRPDLIAFSATTYAYKTVKKMAARLKQALNAPHVVGGIHPTALPEYVLTTADFDVACLGEGEGALLDLVGRMDAGADITGIENLYIKRGGVVFRNPVRPLIQDLDSLPFPDYDIFAPFGVITGDYAITTSRGCPYSCTYCCNHFYKGLYKGKGRYVRRRSVDNVIEELKINRKRFGFERVYFWDDVFCRDIPWLEEFSEKYRKAIGLPFHCLSRPETLTAETVGLIKAAGCSHVNIGIESGNEHIRKHVLNRHMSDEQIIRAAELVKRHGIKLNVFNMFGIPEEGPSEMWDTIRLNEKISPDGTFGFLLEPFPGTKILDYAKEKKMVTPDQEKDLKEGAIAGLQQNDARTGLNHPHHALALRLKTLLPVMAISPRWLKPFWKYQMKKRRNSRVSLFVYFLYLVGADPSRVKYKAEEFFRLLFYYILPGRTHRQAKDYTHPPESFSKNRMRP
ncbi:MAG: B12-binding domain-containing radical SAM protein [Deltaproteobacteria bacterium]|nr:B12-binding domain-containing radical SAM protein [Deltaproteobacteria bacterium]MBW2041950.1 B12-binding domain-containing radical SAM protein [Deltaproteobacteria bacterium]MBW2132864.1 B12-binding domain-containing radical SAM protein [Deltaproteobacteria bacterium]